jgi:lipopolysaccharide biosynthesis glycosyltransferase
MKTKLVYVLTCSEDEYYIEQALMSVFSARHWNPDAHIVLLVDDQTNCLLVGKRAEILNYVSEKIVVPFEDATLSPVYRSRWIKTSVRQLVQGDFLYIDCDTIVQKSMSELDEFTCEIGAVLDSHLLIKEYIPSIYNKIKRQTSLLEIELENEIVYFSSGVLYVKDTYLTNRIYRLWNQIWEEFLVDNSFIADQPSLAKANILVGRAIQCIPDVYNCIVYTQNGFTRNAKILHISSYKNPSYLFTSKVLQYVRKFGLDNDWIISSILNPCATFLPFNYDLLHSSFRQRRQWIKEISVFSRGYGKYIDSTFADFPMLSRFRRLVVWLFGIQRNRLAARMWMLWSRVYVWKHRATIKDNVCKR